MTSSGDDRIEVGYVSRAHGIRGEVRVVTHDPASTILAEVDEVAIGDRVFELVSARPAKDAFIVRLAGVTDRNRAETLRGQTVTVSRDDIALDEGEFLLADLIGCEVVLLDGSGYGEVAALEHGPQDLLVIHHDAVERLVPLVPEIVVEIDLDAGRIVVDPPEGLPETPRQ